MQTLAELGQAIAQRRRSLNLRQGDVAQHAGLAPESLSRLERGRSTEFGTRKLLAVLAVLGLELELVESGSKGTLDQLRQERGGGA